MLILYVIGCIIAGIILAFLLAPIVIILNRKNLKEMERLVNEFRKVKNDDAEYQKLIDSYRVQIYALKSKIAVVDKVSLERARDLVSQFEALA